MESVKCTRIVRLTFAFPPTGANNAQTQNFNTLVLQLLSQIKLIKDQDYKG